MKLIRDQVAKERQKRAKASRKMSEEIKLRRKKLKTDNLELKKQMVSRVKADEESRARKKKKLKLEL